MPREDTQFGSQQGNKHNPGGQTKNQRLLKQAWAEYLESDLTTKTGEAIKRLDAIFKLFDEELFIKKEKWALEFAMTHIAPRSFAAELSGSVDVELDAIAKALAGVIPKKKKEKEKDNADS